jgi:hypothetical protein
VKARSRLPLFAAVSGLSASLAFGLAYFGGHEVSRHLAVAPWLALLLLLPAPLLGWVARRALGPRGPVAGALAAGLVAPMILLGCLNELDEPLVPSFIRWCGTARTMLVTSVPPAMFVAGALAGILAVPLAARAGAGLHRAATGLCAVAALLAGASVLRAARFSEPDRYVGALPIVAAVRAASGTPAMVAHPYADHEPHPADVHPTVSVRGPLAVYDEDLGGALLRRGCSEHRCEVTMVLPDTSPAKAGPTRWDVNDDEVVQVRRDAPHDIWIVEAQGRTPYRGPWLRRDDVRVRDVASSLTPPPGWIAGALAGLAFAGLLLALRRRADTRRAALAAGREGTLEASGQIVLPGGAPPLRAAPRQALALGPVVVLGGEGSPGGLYRGDALAGGARVVCGARADLLAAADARMATLDALALAALALTAAPLLASALVGLLP